MQTHCFRMRKFNFFLLKRYFWNCYHRDKNTSFLYFFYYFKYSISSYVKTGEKKNNSRQDLLMWRSIVQVRAPVWSQHASPLQSAAACSRFSRKKLSAADLTVFSAWFNWINILHMTFRIRVSFLCFCSVLWNMHLFILRTSLL